MVETPFTVRCGRAFHGSSMVETPFRTYPETGRNVVEWRSEEQKFKGEEEEESDEQNQTVASQ